MMTRVLTAGRSLQPETRTAANEQPTVIVIAASVVFALVVGLLANSHPRWGAAAMAAAVLALAAVFTRVLSVRMGLVVLLIVACFVDRFTFPVGRVDTRPEQIAALVAAGYVVVDRVRAQRLLSLKPNLVEGLLLAWFMIGCVSTLVAAPDRGHSLKILALLIVSSLGLFLPRRLLAEHSEDLDRVVRWLLLAFAVESVYALVTYFLHLFGPTISLSVNRGHWSAYGTLWEPNVLGAVCAAGAVAWTFLGRRYFRHAWLGISVCVFACGVSFARTAWIALAIVLVLTLAMPLRRRLDLRTLGLATIAVLVVIAGILAAEKLGSYAPGYAGGKISGGALGDPGNPADVLGRLYQLEPILVDLQKQPILGGGTDSFGERHTTRGQPDYIGNLEMLAVNDTGLVGLLVFAAFLIAIAVEAWRGRRDQAVLGLGAMMLVVAITNQSTETLELMITWLLIGLLLAAIQAATPTRPASVRTAPDTG